MSETATLGATLTGAIPLALTVSLTYDGCGGGPRIVLTGAQTYVVDLAMMPAAGLKGLLIVLDSLDNAGSPVTAPITLTWTSDGVSKSQEISATATKAGWFGMASPAPVNGITALSIVSTANAVVHVAALG